MKKVLLSLIAVILAMTASADNDLPSLRKKAAKLQHDGNYKEAYEAYRSLVLNKDNDPKLTGEDLLNGIRMLQNCNRVEEIDAFREETIAANPTNWILLQKAAASLINNTQWGYIISGEFKRGNQRGGGRYVNSIERDRIRALQIMVKGLPAVENAERSWMTASFYQELARIVIHNRGGQGAWQLQYLSDLSTLPDYEEQHYGYGGSGRGAPVNPDGTPVYYKIAKEWPDAVNDGERYRWCLLQVMETDDRNRLQALSQWADLMDTQFGAKTLAEYGRFFSDPDDDTRTDESGTYALHTLGEDETIARLATGVKRFKLPDEYNFVHIYQALADGENNNTHWGAIEKLATIFEDRRQYPKAAQYWQRAITLFGPGHDNYRQKRLDQILKNWGRFEPVMTQPAGQGATVEFRFRNADEVQFEAYAIKVDQLLRDVKAYIKSSPKQLDWDKINIGDIGYRIVQRDEKKYVGKRVAEWTLPLKPLPNHFDRRITVTTPLQKAGAYLLKATTRDGNVSQIIMWLDDTAIVKKPLNEGTYFFLADAVNGKPLSKVNLSFFGYRQNWVQGSNRYNVETQEFAEFTDADGQYIQKKSFDGNYQWIILATTPDGRMAHLGFTGMWHGNYYDQEYNQTKVYLITDRPVYRPDQPVKYKFWIATAKYDEEGASSFANQEFVVEAQDPQGTKIFETTLTSDEFGGMGGEFTLTKDAKLGVCQLLLKRHNSYLGSGSFRIEEYKKPEFEVKVIAPDEPSMLGEKIQVKVEAKYYFGAPVTKAKATLKINRFSHKANWYPRGRWDWFYGRGYWWFAYNYLWYPGWHEWGCWRPLMWWWPSSPTPPELVADSRLELGPDGTATVTIDTALAKAMHADTDHRYEVTVEVTDESRRTIVGSSSILVARKPFKVYAWVDRGHYRIGDVIQAEFQAQTIDSKAVQGKGELRLFKIGYGKENEPVETEVQKWKLDTDAQGHAQMQMKASESGQYRLSYKVRDVKKHAIEGGYVFTIMGAGTEASQFRFNNLELVPDKREYAPGENVRCRINTDRAGSTVVLFLRPANGTYLPPKVLRMDGKSAVEIIAVIKKDMPNFFVEAFTVSGGKVFTETREVVVPPEKRVFNVAITPDAASYKPGAKAKINVKLTDLDGEPIRGSTVLTIYDKALEYISGGSNVAEIKTFFWKWRRSHHVMHESSLERMFYNLDIPGTIGLNAIGAFGDMVSESRIDMINGLENAVGGGGGGKRSERRQKGMMMARSPMPAPAKMAMKAGASDAMMSLESAAGEAEAKEEQTDEPSSAPGDTVATKPDVQPMIRTKFADNAYWNAFLNTDSNGVADVEFTMPENLTGWKIKSWAMGRGTRVGESEAAVVTVKNLLLRLQAPRFFTEKDEVVLSANVHNYLKDKKQVTVVLELDGPCLKPLDKLTRKITIDAKGEERIDWRVKAVKEGEAIIRMKALTDEESDAMEMRFPVQVHGMLKTVSYSGVIRPDMTNAKITLDVPAERRIDQSMLEIRYSPTLAGAMVDALPYLLEYPYGCTEQVLNRFLPAVMTQKILIDMGLDLKTIKARRTNLNAQEIGDDAVRAAQWKRFKSEPVFDQQAMTDIVKEGVRQMTAMQCADGGWGWFSGYGEQSYPHTTAYVVHGMQMAVENDVALVPGVLERGLTWLQNYQNEQVRLLKNAPSQKKPWKSQVDDLDAFVFMVLTDAGIKNGEMLEFLYRDRTRLAVYGKSMFGMALQKLGDKEKLDMIIRNIEQYLVQDEENQTAYLKLDNGYYWWYWYGSEFEAHAYYLKLLAKTDPTGVKASRLVKYLLNNRKHATYWNSTRDTALCIEALADYLRASKEDKPDMTVEILVDGRMMKEVKINRDNLFSFDNKFIMLGDALENGKHTVEFRKKGTGPLYFNAYLTNFTLEDFITRAGLEVKVNRKLYKLVKSDKSIKVEGVRGQALDQKVEKYDRVELDNNAALKSGDLVEVELSIESKNDYEYLIFEDMKAAGFEAVEVRSGYNNNDMGAYVEFRDNRVCFFVRVLARGKHSVAYRLRAEIPGRFSALPTRAWAMYAPELKANSDEIKLQIED